LRAAAFIDHVTIKVADYEASGPAAAIHIAFVASDRATVDAFHVAAIAAGGVDNGAPAVCHEVPQ
jgi:hypothetical protein